MGLGDDVMATGEALALHKRTGQNVRVGKSLTRPSRSPIFENIPFIDQSNGPTVLLKNYIGNRPYIDYRRSNSGRQVFFQDHRPARGVLVFSDAEQEQAEWLMTHARQS